MLICVATLLPSIKNLVLCCLNVEKTVAGICEAMPVSDCLTLLLLSRVITSSISGRSGIYYLETVIDYKAMFSDMFCCLFPSDT